MGNKFKSENDDTTISMNNQPKKTHNGFDASRALVNAIPEIMFISTYPPNECGIAVYTRDLITALTGKFDNPFTISICAIEPCVGGTTYKQDVKYILDTSHSRAFLRLAKIINMNEELSAVVLQHEFGFFEGREDDLIQLLSGIIKPLIVVFHTVLPNPEQDRKIHMQQIAATASAVVVMTNTSAEILSRTYGVPKNKITVIPHGTHLVSRPDKNILKSKYNVEGRTILSTFGLLSSGKSIETTLNALPQIINTNPDVLFLIIGKTHPGVVKREGEIYRSRLEGMVSDLNLQNHVQFLNYFLPLPVLLDYLQLTDIYLFTSNDPNQAVSGTFSYALSSGCPVVSTPIPHAREVLRDDAGTIIDFNDSNQLADAVNNLLRNENLKKNISRTGLQRTASTAWENSAIAHAGLIEKIADNPIELKYSLPPINLAHVNRLSTDFGIIQFSDVNIPDLKSGYTLDDNARALVAICQHFEYSQNEEDLLLIRLYFNFIKYCFRPDGYFMNYVDENKEFTDQNKTTNLEDSTGRAIWALGYLISLSDVLPVSLVKEAATLFQKALVNAEKIHSSRAMAFIIKGLYFKNLNLSKPDNSLAVQFAERLSKMYLHEETDEWKWFESYLTYANAILPEAMLCAWQMTGDLAYQQIAKASMDFLLSKIFIGDQIRVISNKRWLQKDSATPDPKKGGEQPVDVAYTILALNRFYAIFHDEKYSRKMEGAFDWYLGLNHLHQIMYNPGTGGCYDGLEEFEVNINQGAESTISYLMSRLEIEKNRDKVKQFDRQVNEVEFVDEPAAV